MTRSTIHALYVEIAEDGYGFDPPAERLLLCALPPGTAPKAAATRFADLHATLVGHYPAWQALMNQWREQNPWEHDPTGSQSAHRRLADETWFAAQAKAQQDAWKRVLGHPLLEAEQILLETLQPRPRQIRIRSESLPLASPTLFTA